jgi:hypothetical protein
LLELRPCHRQGLVRKITLAFASLGYPAALRITQRLPDRSAVAFVFFVRFGKDRIFKARFDEKTGKTNTMGIIEQFAEIKEKEGLERGREEVTRTFVENLLKQSSHSLEDIASLTNVSLETVKKIKSELHRN